MDRCGNCGEILGGTYCAACGQKRLVDGDRRLAHLLGQFFAAATDLDGRFWRSLRALLLQPGRLSREYLDGRRRHWMGPMALFLLANVLYFIAPDNATDFNLPLSDQMNQVHSPVTRPWVVQRVAERDRALQARRAALPEERRDALPARYSMVDYAREYDVQTGNVGKALIIVHVPFMAAGLWLLFGRRRMYFAEHVVVATHLFTFMLMYIQVALRPLEWLVVATGLRDPVAVRALMIGAFALMLAYIARAVHRVYAPRAWVSLLSPLVLVTALMAGNVLIYRALQFVLTYWLTA
jgi:hypothetical protein